MADLLSLMVLPFLVSVVLVGIHAYLGLHVIQRGVIFVDLALAQVAALGATLGFLLGFGMHSTGSYLVSLIATLSAAAVFSYLKREDSEVPQEAIIGIVYAVSSAAAIICLSYAPEGGEELKALLVGHLLFVSSSDLLEVFIAYSVIGLIHWLFRKQFLLASFDLKEAKRIGMSIRLWDFFFYAIFGFVVTSSVKIAGVLLVFTMLIVPAVSGVLLAKSVVSRLLVGWGFGIVATSFGILTSYYFDLPTGAAIVCLFGVFLIIVYVALKPRK